LNSTSPITHIPSELDAFANESDVIWRGFVASAIAAVALQWVNPFGTGKMVLFQVTFVSDTWRAFELVSNIFGTKHFDNSQFTKVPWVILGVIGVILLHLLRHISLTLVGCLRIPSNSLKRGDFSLQTQNSAQRLAGSGSS